MYPLPVFESSCVIPWFEPDVLRIDAGLVVPIPTLPVEVIYNLVALVPELAVCKAKVVLPPVDFDAIIPSPLVALYCNCKLLPVDMLPSPEYIVPLMSADPDTWSFWDGLVLPIPTLPPLK